MAATQVALTTPSFQLITADGEPMDSEWHRLQMNLLIEVIRLAMVERGRTDSFAGGNMFIYYSVAQARAVATEPPERTRHFRGPDVFWVSGARVRGLRDAWLVWDEDGRYPDLIIELLSPSTASIDRTTKKEIYERTFRTPDYFMYDREARRVEGYRLIEGVYRPVTPDASGRWPVASLGLWLGAWRGTWQAAVDTDWLRLYDDTGRLIPTAEEAARQERDAAVRQLESERREKEAARRELEAERQRADAAEAEIASRGGGRPTGGTARGNG